MEREKINSSHSTITMCFEKKKSGERKRIGNVEK